MGKKLKVESAKYHFLIACREASLALTPSEQLRWDKVVNNIFFENDKTTLKISVKPNFTNEVIIDLNSTKFYVRGDNKKAIDNIHKDELDGRTERVQDINSFVFKEAARKFIKIAIN